MNAYHPHHFRKPPQALRTGDAAADAVLASLPGTGHVVVQADLRDAAQVQAITHLVASSVEGLKPENIVVVDSNGNLLHKTFEPDQAGTAAKAVVIGKLDTLHQGKLGDYLTIQFNDKATPAIVQTLAAHIYLGVTDSTGALTQNWSAAAGEKLIEFKLKDSASAVAVTATREMTLISHPEDDASAFNVSALAVGAPSDTEVFADMVLDSAAATLPGYLGSVRALQIAPTALKLLGVPLRGVLHDQN